MQMLGLHTNKIITIFLRNFEKIYTYTYHIIYKNTYEIIPFINNYGESEI